MQSIYSSDVEDLVSSNFIYNNGCSGTIMVNWSDETYRKPTNIVTIFGTKGKIIADKHAYKIYLKEPDQNNGFHKGGIHVILLILPKVFDFMSEAMNLPGSWIILLIVLRESRIDNISSFAEAFKTDVIMENIRQDAARSLTMGDVEP